MTKRKYNDANSDLTVVITTPSNTNKGSPFQVHQSKKYRLHTAVACRSSSVLRSLFGNSDSKITNRRIELDMSRDEEETFAVVVKFMYHGGKIGSVGARKMAACFGVELLKEEDHNTPQVVESRSMTTTCDESSMSTMTIPPVVSCFSTILDFFAGFIPSSKEQALVIEEVQGGEDDKSMTETPSATKANDSGASVIACSPQSSLFELPSLVRSIQGGEKENLEVAKESLSVLLDQQLLFKGGADNTTPEEIQYLLAILSDDDFAAFHGTAADVICELAKRSEALASRFLAAQAIECLITSQLVHGTNIRGRSLKAIAYIASHSSDLAVSVAKKHGCIAALLDGLRSCDLCRDAISALYQLCRLAPLVTIQQDIFDELWNPLPGSRRKAFISMAHLLTAMSKAKASKLSLKYAVGSFFKEDSDSAQQKEKLVLIKPLLTKPFVVTALLDDYHSPFDKKIARLLYSSDREVQKLACETIGTLVKFMRIFNRTCREYEENLSNIYILVVQLMSYKGTFQEAAALACAEMTRLNYSRVAESVPVTAFVNILATLDTTTCKGAFLAESIFMALQTVLSNSNHTEQNGVDVTTMIGTGLAKAMMPTNRTETREQSITVRVQSILPELSLEYCTSTQMN